MTSLDVVHITWLDSQSVSDWSDIDAIDSELLLTHTVGCYLMSTDNSVVVALSYDPQTDGVHSVKHIPIVAIMDLWLICSIQIA